MNLNSAAMSAPALPSRRPEDRISYRRSPGRRPGFIDHRQFLITESRALLTRLRQVTPFSLRLPMAPAANVAPAAQSGVHKMLEMGVVDMKKKVRQFISLLQNSKLNATDAQKAFTLVKLQFNWLLDRMDIFADALSQRGEHETGVFLAGLDALAEDALRLEKHYYDLPPLVTYLDRGHGAAIRRARTRLPGGATNPVAVIRVPRERMISTGIASSIIHEVGHQGSTLLDLISPLGGELREMSRYDPENKQYWNWYERWISEILSDFWGVATLGIGSSTGLMNVVSVPSYFVFRLNADDPHPPPWLRVKISLAIGQALYPDPQWRRFSALWSRLYPIRLAPPEKQGDFRRLEALIPDFIQVLINHHSERLKGQTLAEIFPVKQRQPHQLRRLYRQWSQKSALMRRIKPSMAFAIIGQARADNVMSPEKEHQLLRSLLRWWAVRKTII